jgi:hypothetical protein
VTVNSDLAKSISSDLASVLKPAGFRKRANSFNRRVQDGVVHHISLQLGSYDPSGQPDIPGLRVSRHGRYRVNLGVHVPEMNRMGSPRSTWIFDYNCNLRWGLGDFMPSGFSQWWDLRDRLAIEEIRDALEHVALPRLTAFNDGQSVLDAYAEKGERAFGPIAPKAVALDVADLLLARGQRDEAAALLGSYATGALGELHPAHKDYLRRYLAERDFEELSQSVR